MCGIIGVVNNKVIDQAIFSKQLSSIQHRGPNDVGSWFNYAKTVGLGSRRLAIQDLTSNGHMPMISENGRYVIVFNGEIYNFPTLKQTLIKNGFTFKSNSDTEGVLNSFMLWGIDCLAYIEGMFAIAIYDNETESLFLARDRAGEKPLYYWQHKNGLSFGSELKALLLDNNLHRKLNHFALKQYLEDGYVKGNNTFIEGVNKLPAAHYLLYNINNENCNIKRYWSLPPSNNNLLDKEDLVGELDVILSKAVKKQLIADVPLGVLLSGGIDSSLITAYAAEHSSNKIKTFHISFDGFGKYNESEYARKVANYFDTEHIELTGNSISFDLIDELINYYDEPLADSSMLPTFLVSQLTKEYVTVAIGGDGGDELFGGYINYPPILNHHKRIQKIPTIFRNAFASLSSFLPSGLKGRNYLMNLKGEEYERFMHNRLFDPVTMKKVLSQDMWEKIANLNTKPQLCQTNDFLYDMTKFDFENYMNDDVLVKVDRASMAFSLEMRAPFLDKDVIEFAFGKVPSYLKANGSTLKILPKELLKRKLKIDFNVDRKQGFSIPLNEWIGNKWEKEFYEEINAMPEIINRKYAISLFNDSKKGYSNSSKLYSLIILSKWIKKFKIEV